MKFFTRNKELFRLFFPLLITITLTNLITLAVNLADNIMLGTYNEMAMSGAAVVNQIQFLLQQLVNGIGSGVIVLSVQYWGKGEVDPVRRIISLGLKISLLAGIIFFIVSSIAPVGILRLLTNEKTVIAEGVRYLRVMRWSYLLFSINYLLMYAMRSVQAALIGTVMSISTLLINIALNYMLIYGNLGAPELGVAGAAIATLASRMIELIIILTYILRLDQKLHVKLRHLLAFDLTYLRDFIKVALPVMLSGMMWGVAQAAQTAILGHMSAVVIAANSIAIPIFQVFSVFCSSGAAAAAVTIGKTIGEGCLELIRPYTRTLQLVFLVIGLLAGAGIFLCKDLLVGFYAITDETRAMTLQFLTVLSITTVGTCFEYPLESGIIAGGGDTKYAPIVDNLFMWLFTIPFSAASAFLFGLPPVVTFCFLKADQLLKCIPNTIYCNSYKWVRTLTRPDKPVA